MRAFVLSQRSRHAPRAVAAPPKGAEVPHGDRTPKPPANRLPAQASCSPRRRHTACACYFRRWALLAAALLLCVAGCELRDDTGKGLHIEHHPPNVKVDVGPINLPAWRRNVDPRNCSCCRGGRCLCGKNCSCRCER